MRLSQHKLGATTVLAGGALAAAPEGFPASGKGLWYTTPGSIWTTQYLPVGNGYLGAMTPGGTTYEATQLNIESLWSGGPFQNASYDGGNFPAEQKGALAQSLADIQQAIFTSENDTTESVAPLQTAFPNYGSYSGAGYLVSSINSSSEISAYSRWLDLETAVAYTVWTEGDVKYTRSLFCSYPSKACTSHTTSSADSLPLLTYAFSSDLQADLPNGNVTCLDSTTLVLRGNAPSEPGMLYELVGRVDYTGGNVSCSAISDTNATISVTGASSARIVWLGDTEYSIDAGDEAHGFSFKGDDPHDKLVASFPDTAYNDSLQEHLADVEQLFSVDFSLDIGQTVDLNTPTDELVNAYQTDVGNPYLEWLLFHYGRYLVGTSARGTLPLNLQGVWAQQSGNPWSADYHANINLQMNYWIVDSTGMDVAGPLWDYMEKTWAPRGSQTADILYGARGWVVHNEMNIFGHTGMKGDGSAGSATWADYPEAAAWMAYQVFDHFDFTGDQDWWKSQGWPLLKGIALFQYDRLVEDAHFNDSTLVTAPCNSPEYPNIGPTFGCTHSQQVIWELFSAVLKGYKYSGDDDDDFFTAIQGARDKLDHGIHIGSWGQLQEWKIDRDDRTYTHRHISHLLGLYPGYSLANYNSTLQNPSFTREQVLGAAGTSLQARGVDISVDGDGAWSKVHRAAAWAQLGHVDNFYHSMTFSLQHNFGSNLFSVYNPDAAKADQIFQIDANAGYPAALLHAIIHAPDVPSLDIPVIITVLPCLPSQWNSGEVRGVRIRGGLAAHLTWAEGVPKSLDFKANDDILFERPFQVVYKGAVVKEFVSSSGASIQVTF
ncbi:glycoside hydrolase family 95 protein [Cylindrobasidium torrendii FP15055 ss-10]|uniref:Glycoside hydrolase family 95 protein n=1 Tax=Cylindrobasidium torrendii FP15055 ss-10 TaxID=1314674 RepID=A0A0D7B2V8_9AGAR|nr:glycoside hydrolase family 95 protein [Cylindrobasidium torrendii FP15055 ss-10]